MLSKKELRIFIRQQKTAHTSSELRILSERICRDVCRLAIWQSAQSILLYYPLADEVDVLPLIQEAHKAGKQVFLPVVSGPESIEVRRYLPDTPMQTGAFGIQEPSGKEISNTEYKTIELAVVPGMGFDRQGHRLGRGKGYYDRLLTRMPQAYLVGICFPSQLLPHIPSEKHDICMQKVCSLTD